MKKFFRGFGRNLRATRRAATGVAVAPLLLTGVVLQGFVVGPIFKNYTILPNMFHAVLCKLIGIRVEFNKASAPLEKDRQVWFVANHQSMADIPVLGAILKGTFAGKGDILTWPVVSQMARAVKYIGIQRVKKDDPDFKKVHAQTVGKIIKNFNEGGNTIMFPEGTTTDGSYLALFRAGLISLLYGEKGTDSKGNEIKLQKKVVVQPLAVKVMKVDGKNVNENTDLRDYYSYFHEHNTLRRVWNRMKSKSIELEITAFEPLDPADFKDQFELINKAWENVRDVVSPDQQEPLKAAIPGVDDHRDDTYTPPKPPELS